LRPVAEILQIAGQGVRRMIENWDDAYANGAHIVGADSIVAGWAQRAAMLRARVAAEVVQVGPEGRQVVEL